MSLRPLVVLPDPRLSQRSEEMGDCDFSGLSDLVRDMFDTMYEASGIGLAGVQIGVMKRIFVMDTDAVLSNSSSKSERTSVLEKYRKAAENTGDSANDVSRDYEDHCGPTVVINPEIVETSGRCVLMEEGCLSIPGQSEMVSRPELVVLSYLDKDLNKCTMRAKGLLSRCIQHELDHLNGIVFINRLSKLKRDLVLAQYRKSAVSRGA
ncbi:peptide deformylase [Candidatus Anaplasma sp. TIGMIC]|uniref:peptide deformylase n=1 Tax=Candidatus Anaplasma sp. TIGMIC TaxID=3020713 RepID=UPI002330D3DA|nr:peptide deformylase [Candidatus Anaplasma sp. TIGMIC]MDB1135684.1 peptide deformylase [Candidatus Anaplasma sp. TIGMIC]